LIAQHSPVDSDCAGCVMAFIPCRMQLPQ
jgi:hypothetical protein